MFYKRKRKARLIHKTHNNFHNQFTQQERFGQKNNHYSILTALLILSEISIVVSSGLELLRFIQFPDSLRERQLVNTKTQQKYMY